MSNSQKVAGMIGIYGLSEWWFNTFSEEERNYMNLRYRTRAGPNALIEGTHWTNPDSIHYGVSFFLNNLTFWFRHPKDNSIARRIAFKAYELAEDIENISSALGWIIRLYYPVRDTVPGALDLVIASCKHQIALAPTLIETKNNKYRFVRSPEVAEIRKEKYIYPALHKHEGYNRYTIILEKNHEYAEAIRLCEEAKKQGWEGDWDKRIERCSKRLSNKSRGRSKSNAA
jgi:hypothetical protein